MFSQISCMEKPNCPNFIYFILNSNKKYEMHIGTVSIILLPVNLRKEIVT